MISIITRTYNRAHVIERAIRSILVQDYTDFEVIVVNDGSTDNTLEIIAGIGDPRIRTISHKKNRGMAAAFHTGLDNIKGDWFTLLDSDDEMIPDALSTMLKIPEQINPKINAITCNCIDTTTGEFSGKGLFNDQYLDAITILQKCRGEFWGLTKTSLLPERSNEQYLAAIWNKINKKATRYYIHKCLRKYYTNGDDRYSLASDNLCAEKQQRLYETYLSLLNEKELLADYKKYGRDFYRDLHFSMGTFFIQYGDKKLSRYCIKEVALSPKSTAKFIILITGYIFGKKSFAILKKLKRRLFGNYKLK
jgi:glycosyltransferase involved in cell wall biosynthesis